MSQTYVSLYRQTLALRQEKYDASLTAGEYDPFLYPWDAFFGLYALLAIVLTPKVPERLRGFVRYLAFTLGFIHSLYLIRHRRALGFAGGYGIGLCIAWSTIMSGALLLCNDPGRDYWRLEAREAGCDDSTGGHDESTTMSASLSTNLDMDVRQRKVPSVYTATDVKQNGLPGSHKPVSKSYKLVWQGFPYDAGWLHIIDWTVDLVTGFRGVNWNHRIATLARIDAPIPPIPTRGQDKKTSEVYQDSKPTAILGQTLQALQRRAVQDFLIGYLVLDLLKTSMVTDPYFFGLAELDDPSPWFWLAVLTERVPFATRFVRLGMSMAGVLAALTFIFSLSPLFFTRVLPSLVDVSKVTRSPLLEPWLYPPQLYPLTTSVLHTGLAGFWGKFWHQMFRYGISQPSRVLIRKLDLDPSGNTARLVQLLSAFALSGSIHAAGSFTAFSLVKTNPLSGSLLFFLLQALGIFTQTLVVKILHANFALTKPLPRAVGQTTNAVVTLGFLYITGPLLANDLARSGIWLFEPVPISILRGLGFGPGGKDEGFWTWYQDGSTSIGWWKGTRWWETGLAAF